MDAVVSLEVPWVGSNYPVKNNVLGRWLDGSDLVLKILSVSLSWFTIAHTRPLFYTGASVSEIRSSSMSRSEVSETGGRQKCQEYHSLPHDRDNDFSGQHQPQIIGLRTNIFRDFIESHT
jgi:hypothetical protein